MLDLTIKYGARSAFRQYANATPPTVKDLKSDHALKLELGFGDNVNVMVNGVTQPDHTFIPGPTVTIETAANEKN